MVVLKKILLKRQILCYCFCRNLNLFLCSDDSIQNIDTWFSSFFREFFVRGQNSGISHLSFIQRSLDNIWLFFNRGHYRIGWCIWARSSSITDICICSSPDSYRWNKSSNWRWWRYCTRCGGRYASSVCNWSYKSIVDHSLYNNSTWSTRSKIANRKSCTCVSNRSWDKCQSSR